MRFKILSLTLLSAIGAIAQSGSAVSLDSCRTLALVNNRSLMVARERIATAHYHNREAFAAYLPSIDFAGGYMYNQRNISIFDSDQLLPTKTFNPAKGEYEFNLVTNPATGAPVKGPDGQYIPETVALIPKDAMTFDIHNVFFGAVTLTQPIFMGGKIVAMNKLTHEAENIAREMHINEAENVIYAVDAAYWQVVSLKAKQRLAASYVALLDTLSRNVHLMHEQGIATRSDVLSVDVKLNAAQVDMTKVDNGLALSRMALAQVCGLPVNTVLALADEDADALIPATELADDYNMNEVYARRPDLRALGMGVKAAGYKKDVARSAMMPNLALVGAYTFSNPNMNDGFSKSFGGGFSVGAMVTIPLWHWGGNYNKYKAAKSEQIAMQLQLEDARTLVDLQVSQASFKTKEAYKTYTMTCANIAQADENLRSATLGFKEGVATTLNVMEAQTAWLKAHSERIDAEVDVRLCNTYLQKALGTLYGTKSQQ